MSEIPGPGAFDRRRIARNRELLARFRPGQVVRRGSRSGALGVVEEIRPHRFRLESQLQSALPEWWFEAYSTPVAKVAWDRRVGPNCRGGKFRLWVDLKRLEVVEAHDTNTQRYEEEPK